MRPCSAADFAAGAVAGRRGGGERFVFLEAHWLALCDRAADALRTFHAEQPDEPGIDRGRLRRMTFPTWPTRPGAP